MDKQKVLNELGERTADPMSAEACKAVIGWIDNNRPMGKLILDLLAFAENGNFK